ncbi:uncharacterized protein C8A04DRAFT_35892 [Dichotomopilus funicola]|uniref:Tim44-like domain-containing protein n=1 Tax=Dichotomopilus funicola TaxID=1934379 RepID=A0AAN6V7D9_9PEZI|nr:hypothetical protein C8A04DRAFT_35892 [Dichotomopilus funicola]
MFGRGAGRVLLAARTAAPTNNTPLFLQHAGFRQTTGSPSASAPFSTTTHFRSRTHLQRAALEFHSPPVASQQSPRAEQASAMQKNALELATRLMEGILPGTFVLPPFSQFPKGIMPKLRLLGYWALSKGQETTTNLGLKYISKPSLLTRAKYRPKRSEIIPTVKALHRAMAQAFATGDRHTINKICSRRLASSLLPSIDARPRGQRHSWELVRYTDALMYPTLRSHRMMPLDKDKNAPFVRQVVVAISSKQRKVSFDPSGRAIPGSEKEIDVVENVVMSCIVQPLLGWRQSEWRMVGVVKPTTVEAWAEEQELLKQQL